MTEGILPNGTLTRQCERRLLPARVGISGPSVGTSLGGANEGAKLPTTKRKVALMAIASAAPTSPTLVQQRRLVGMGSVH